MTPLVSVIIPTHSRDEQLLRLLDSIYKSEYPRDQLEVIVVDNANSKPLADELHNLHPDIKLIQPGKNLYCNGGRKKGADNAKGDLLFFVDDDNVLDPACINALVKSFHESTTLGVAGPLMLIYRNRQQVWCAGGAYKLVGPSELSI